MKITGVAVMVFALPLLILSALRTTPEPVKLKPVPIPAPTAQTCPEKPGARAVFIVSPLSVSWQETFRSAVARWENLAHVELAVSASTEAGIPVIAEARKDWDAKGWKAAAWCTPSALIVLNSYLVDESNLEAVAVHEIGHILGLAHPNTASSVMRTSRAIPYMHDIRELRARFGPHPETVLHEHDLGLCRLPLPELRIGDTGACVEHLQWHLERAGYGPVEIDGGFSVDTEVALRSLKEAHGLSGAASRPGGADEAVWRTLHNFSP